MQSPFFETCTPTHTHTHTQTHTHNHRITYEYGSEGARHAPRPRCCSLHQRGLHHAHGRRDLGPPTLYGDAPATTGMVGAAYSVVGALYSATGALYSWAATGAAATGAAATGAAATGAATGAPPPAELGF